LRGTGGVAVGLPLLEAMLPARAVHAAGPRRFVVFFTPNGTNDYKAFMPQVAGGSFTLGVESDPLLPLKDKLLVLSNVFGRSASQQSDGDQHGVGMAHMLTCIRTATGPKVDDITTWGGGISIDQKIAQALAAPTRFPSLELGVQTTVGTKGTGVHPFSRMVYKDRLQPVPSQDDPREVWKRLFSDLPATAGGGAPGAGAAPAIDQAREQRRSVLDFVRVEYQRLGTRLGARDRQKMDAHLTAIREIEMRLGAPTMVAAGCRRPAEPPAALTPSDPRQFPEIGKLQIDLLALALACDLTRVASLQWSWARSDVAMSWIGVRDSHHEMSHGKASPTLSSVNRWYAEQLARFATALDALGEGGASVLDNSVVWWCSDVSFGPLHSFTNLRAFLLGSCGGFFKTGQHIAFPGTTATINQLMVTFMRAMGIAGATQFGDPAVPPGALPGMG
jgi:hypothetical protein